MGALGYAGAIYQQLKSESDKKPQLTEKSKTSSFPEELDTVLSEIRQMLIEKNQSYGDSALNPIQCFSKLDSSQRLGVRIDDKISRMLRGNAYPGDNDKKDLLGYLILDMINEKRKK